MSAQLTIPTLHQKHDTTPQPLRLTATGTIVNGSTCVAILANPADVTLGLQIAQLPMMLDLVRRFMRRDEFVMHVDDSDPHLMVDAVDWMRAAGEIV